MLLFRIQIKDTTFNPYTMEFLILKLDCFIAEVCKRYAMSNFMIEFWRSQQFETNVAKEQRLCMCMEGRNVKYNSKRKMEKWDLPILSWKSCFLNLGTEEVPFGTFNGEVPCFSGKFFLEVLISRFLSMKVYLFKVRNFYTGFISWKIPPWYNSNGEWEFVTIVPEN